MNKSSRGKKILQGCSQYCQQTSLHGWQYVDSESSIICKLIWIIIVISCNITAIGFMVTHFQDFIAATTVTNIESSTASLNEITFPSVYVCNENQGNENHVYFVTYVSRYLYIHTLIDRVCIEKKRTPAMLLGSIKPIHLCILL